MWPQGDLTYYFLADSTVSELSQFQQSTRKLVNLHPKMSLQTIKTFERTIVIQFGLRVADHDTSIVISEVYECMPTTY